MLKPLASHGVINYANSLMYGGSFDPGKHAKQIERLKEKEQQRADYWDEFINTGDLRMLTKVQNLHSEIETDSAILGHLEGLYSERKGDKK